MVKQYLYIVSLLKRLEAHPLEKLAYFSGADQFDNTDGNTYMSSTKDKVFWSDLIMPDRVKDFEEYSHLPEYLKVRNRKPDMIRNLKNILWRDVATLEKSKESQCARIFELSIPSFFTRDVAIEAVEEFSKHLMKKGMLVDASIHDLNMVQAPISLFDKLIGFELDSSGGSSKSQEDSNIANTSNMQDYKAFLMCTLRGYKNGEFTTKNREWNTFEELMENRKVWFNIVERHLDLNDSDPSVKTKWYRKLSNFKQKEKEQLANAGQYKGFRP